MRWTHGCLKDERVDFLLVNEMLNPFWCTVAVVGLVWEAGSDKID